MLHETSHPFETVDGRHCISVRRDICDQIRELRSNGGFVGNVEIDDAGWQEINVYCDDEADAILIKSLSIIAEQTAA